MKWMSSIITFIDSEKSLQGFILTNLVKTSAYFDLDMCDHPSLESEGNALAAKNFIDFGWFNDEVFEFDVAGE